MPTGRPSPSGRRGAPSTCSSTTYAALLVAIGLVMAYTNSVESGAVPLAGGHDVHAAASCGPAIAVVVFIVATAFDYRWLKTLAWPIYALQLGLLVADPRDRRRRRRVGALGLDRPADVPVQRDRQDPDDRRARELPRGARRASSTRCRSILGACLLVGPPLVLVMLQPDLGTSLVFGAILAGMLFMSGASLRWLTRPRGRRRRDGPDRLDVPPARLPEGAADRVPRPNPDIQGAGYQLHQAQIAVGVGRARRQGPDERHPGPGRPPAGPGDRLRVRDARRGARVHRRRSSCSCCSSLLLWRVLVAGWRSRDPFGTLFAAGVASMILFQLVVNVGMVLGVMPITGHPAAVRDPRRRVAGQHGRRPGHPPEHQHPADQGGVVTARRPGDALMVDAEIPHAIELLVGLLGSWPRSSRSSRGRSALPYTVALVIAGLVVGIGAERRRLPAVEVAPELVLLVLLPGPRLRGRLPAATSSSCAAGSVASRSWPSRASSSRPRSSRVVLNVATGLRPTSRSSSARWSRRPTRPRSSRRSSACRCRRRARRRSSRARACSTTAPASSCSRSRSRPCTRPGRARSTAVVDLRRRRRDQRRASASSPASSRPGSSALVDDHLIELTISVVLAYGTYLLADRLGLSGVIATVAAGVVLGTSARPDALPRPAPRRDRHGLGVHRLPADRVRVPARRPRDPAAALVEALGPIAWGDRRRSWSGGRSSSTSCSAARRGSAVGPGSPDRVAERLAARPVLGRSARRGRRRDGAVAARPTPAARAAPGDHLRGRAVHAARPGHDDRLARRPGVRRRPRRSRTPRSTVAPDRALAPAEQPPAVGGLGVGATCAGRSGAGSRRARRGSSARSASGRAIRCTRCPGGRSRRATSRRSARS